MSSQPSLRTVRPTLKKAFIAYLYDHTKKRKNELLWQIIKAHKAQTNSIWNGFRHHNEVYTLELSELPSFTYKRLNPLLAEQFKEQLDEINSLDIDEIKAQNFITQALLFADSPSDVFLLLPQMRPALSRVPSYMNAEPILAQDAVERFYAKHAEDYQAYKTQLLYRSMEL